MAFVTKRIRTRLMHIIFISLALCVLLGAGFISREQIMMNLPVYMRQYYVTHARVIEKSPGENGMEGLETTVPSAQELDAKLMVAYEYQWLKSLVRNDGAMTIGGDGVKVIPYFSNIAAQEMVKDDPEPVKRYMTWYLDNLNIPDRWGLEGTIYDYEIINGKPVPTRRYDSADSYAATFLSLVASYAKTTGDFEFIENNKDKIDLVSGVIISLQDPRDGLVWSKGDKLIKFLMDNTETYRGLSDWASVLEMMGRSDEARYYSGKALEIKEGIETSLWDGESGSYIWAIYPLGIKRKVNWNKWYPDSVSQLYPILNGVIDKDDWKAQSLYATFNSRYPEWPLLQKKDPFPWASVAYVAQTMGDTQNVNTFIQTIQATYLSCGRPYPWYSLESTYLIKTQNMIARLTE